MKYIHIEYENENCYGNMLIPFKVVIKGKVYDNNKRINKVMNKLLKKKWVNFSAKEVIL